MSSGPCKKFFLLLSFLFVVSCGGGGGTGAQEEAPILKINGLHPRLLLTLDKQEYLRAGLATTHKFLWDRYLEDLPRMIGVSRGTLPLRDERYSGDLVAELAFAWLMTGEDSLLAEAKSHLLKLTDDSQWQAQESLIYLISSHFLMGVALGYDWLYPALTAQERAQVSACLSRQAEKQYRYIVEGRAWWRNQYYQNHSHSNFCGLAFAAAALYGEDQRAPEWLRVCEDFFEKVFQVMPEDGSSVEGYAYAGYGGEYILKYAFLARDLLGRDYTQNSWMKNYTGYMVHGLLPLCRADEWAMTFGDAPRRGWTSTAQHLFSLTRLYKDPVAQWMGRFVVSLAPRGLGSQGWMTMLYYDPTIGSADPAAFPTFKHFPEIDQVMMRSSWVDTTAMLVGFYCGPFMGKTHSKSARHDWGSGHQNPDAGEFQIFAQGQFLVVDPLYTGYKLTANHNTMLFKGQGQLGDHLPGFASAEALRFGHYPQIIHAETTPAYDYVVGDVARAYHPTLGVQRFTRHVLFVKPDILLVADQVALDQKGMVYSYPSEEINTAGGLEHAANGYVVGPEGEAFVTFRGVPGTYQLTACYLDNVPEAGNYSFAVDGQTVHAWKSQNEDLDDNLLLVSPPVELKEGSRIAFRGQPMAPECRLTMMTAFSDQVAVERQAQWLMHLDPNTELTRKNSHLEAALGGAVLEVYTLQPGLGSLSWEMFKIKKAEIEPFTLRNTKRISISPRFDGSEAGVVVLMHARAAEGRPLEDVQADCSTGQAKISWTRDAKRVTLVWNLDRKTLSLE